MPQQLLLQDCVVGATCLASGVYMIEKDGFVTYFLGENNFFSHRCGDDASHRFALALLMHNGHVRPCELERSALHIPRRRLMNWLRQYRERGADSFYRPRSYSLPRKFYYWAQPLFLRFTCPCFASFPSA